MDLPCRGGHHRAEADLLTEINLLAEVDLLAMMNRPAEVDLPAEMVPLS